MELPILFKLYNTLHPDWHQILKRPTAEYPVPTHLVIVRPDYYIPRTARTFETGLYLNKPTKDANVALSDPRNVCTYADLLKSHKDFPGTAHFMSVVMSEVWGDYSRSGLTQFNMVGWRFVRESDLAERLKFHGTEINTPAAIHEDWPEPITI